MRNRIVGLVGLSLLSFCRGYGQQITRLDREERQVMLKTISDDIRRDYYDPKFHGVDWDAKLAEAKQKIEQAGSKTEANFQIAGLLDSLNDSHTVFIPPQHSVRVDYGWQYQMIGDHCYVIRVKPKSDAAAKGLKPGDEVLSINGFAPSRQGIEKMKYVFYTLFPQKGLHLELRDPSGRMRSLDAMSKLTETSERVGADNIDRFGMRLEEEREWRQAQPRLQSFENRLLIVKLPEFFQSDFKINGLIDQARNYGTLIVDLRGNPGGALRTLIDLLGGMFDHDVKVADEVERSKTMPLVARGFGKNRFAGKLVVLVDSESASAAEVFARVVQIEKRGTVIGDGTAGAVMSAELHAHTYGTEAVIIYGAMVSVADLVMTDGKSLEHVGVTPDEKLVPSNNDLLNGHDPVMVHAADMAGVKLTPEKAAELFPYEWPKE